MKAETLITKLDDMMKETTQNRLKWIVEIKTSEYDETIEKTIVREDNIDWTMNECYVCYSCNFHGENFVMTTYEDIETSGDMTRSFNMVFLPPVGIHLFELSHLLPYSVEMNQPLANKLHSLWNLLLQMQKNNSDRVTFLPLEWTSNDVEIPLEEPSNA